MEHDLELISPILEIVDRTIHIQSYPGNSGCWTQATAQPCSAALLTSFTPHIVPF